MGRLGRPSATVRFAAGASVAVLLATLLSANVLAASNKPFSVTGTPGTIQAGDNPPITLTVTDLTKTQQLGSLEIALSSGFTFSGSPLATVTSRDPNASPSVGLVSPSMLQIQGLNLQPDEHGHHHASPTSSPPGAPRSSGRSRPSRPTSGPAATGRTT